MYTRRAFILFVFAYCITLISCKTARLCENYVSEISCSNDTQLTLFCANYGRLSSNTCGNYNVTNCTTENTLDIFRNQCNATHCVMDPTNDIFGDPCQHIYKYLEVTYLCTTWNKTTLTPVCDENEQLITLNSTNAIPNCDYDTNITVQIGQFCVCKDGYYADATTGNCT